MRGRSRVWADRDRSAFCERVLISIPNRNKELISRSSGCSLCPCSSVVVHKAETLTPLGRGERARCQMAWKRYDIFSLRCSIIYNYRRQGCSIDDLWCSDQEKQRHMGHLLRRARKHDTSQIGAFINRQLNKDVQKQTVALGVACNISCRLFV